MRWLKSGKLSAVFGMMMVCLGCSTTSSKHCTRGGQPAREYGNTISGLIKRCYQVKDDSGNYVNHGRYYEWYPNDHLALKGAYDHGKKTGRWTEFDEKGRVISDRYYSVGIEIPPPPGAPVIIPGSED